MSEQYYTMLAFRDELAKEAAPKWLTKTVPELLARRGAGVAGGLGVGGMVGGLGGLGLGGYRGYQQAREEGAGVGQALGHGVVKGLRSGLIGAGVGAGAGALGGSLLSPKGVDRMTTMGKGIGAASRFGQRQLHGVTGWVPEGGLESIRAGSYGAKKALKGAEERFLAAKGGDASPGFVDRVLGRSPEQVKHKAVTKAEKELLQARKARDASVKAEDMGLTSVPGYLRSLKNNGVGSTVRAGLADQWHGSGGTTGKAMMLGLPAMSVAQEMSQPDQPGGPGKLERIGGALGEGLGFSLAPLPLAGQALAISGLGALGKMPGKLLGRRKLQRGVTADTNFESAAPSTPVEYIRTPSSLDQPPGDVVS